MRRSTGQAVFARLHLQLSDVTTAVVAAYAATTNAPFLYIFADTLVLDSATLPALSTTIVARSIDVSASGATLTSPPPAAHHRAAIQILTAQLGAGKVHLVQAGGAPWTPDLTGDGPWAITFCHRRCAEARGTF